MSDFFEDNAGGSIVNLAIDLIDANPEQARKNFDDEKLSELASSIKSVGVLNPILVYREGDRFTIIAGERRYRACKKLGLTAIPAIIHEADERESSKKSLIENLQREDLNPIEAAEAISDLIEKNKMTQDEVAREIGKARSTVTNLLRLLMLPVEVIDMVRNRELSAGHARCLVVIDDKDVLISFAKMAVSGKLSVHDLETRVKLYFTRKQIPQGPRAGKPAQSRELKELVSDMKRIFATKVKVVGNDKKGRIYIDYFSADDLQRIYELMQILKQD
ncbi:MAG TPA: ParB/RepB/Spo0J family partition protein [Eubacteriales bacterium]|jgi:ParB family chromosome partitioning protein|nr:ParB/RepB/Spo0J family partition protein [Clostridia bacterium]HRR90152.1 ParB/RepB/Spo0J family partition protein [Eubacteriales bacterium]HRU84084.1 ParB/RepB/Spo0J family partition protein [Eubacteriales bacterium]